MSLVIYHRRRVLQGVVSSEYADVIGISDPAIRSEIEYFISNAKSSGIWDRLIGIYPMIGTSFDQFKYNLKDPRDLDEAFRLTDTGVTPPTIGTHTMLGGNIETHISSLSLFDPYSYHFGYYSITQNTAESVLIEKETGVGGIRLLTLNNQIINDGYNYNGGSERIATPIGVSTGFMVAERISETAQRNYHQGVKVEEDLQTASGISVGSGTVEIKSQNLTGGFVTIGDYLTESQNAELYRLVNRMNILLGR